MALDSASLALLAAAREAAGPALTPLWQMAPEEVRRRPVLLADKRRPGPPMHRTDNHRLVGYDGTTFRIRIHVPLERPGGIFVYLHGGGWVLNDIDNFDDLARHLAETSGCAVLLVDYRKAPENRFPAAVEDCWTALEWASEHTQEIAGTHVPLFVGGDSAGGNLAAVMALRSRERNGPQLARQVLIYPVTDADFSLRSYHEDENQTVLPTVLMKWFWDQYVPDPADRHHREASPLRAGELQGVAPAVVITAAHDVLRDEGEAYVQRLRQAGVPTVHRRWPGQMHGFFSMVDLLPAAAEAMEYVAAAIRAGAVDRSLSSSLAATHGPLSRKAP